MNSFQTCRTLCVVVLAISFVLFAPIGAQAAPCGSKAKPSRFASCSCAAGKKRSGIRPLGVTYLLRGIYTYRFRLRRARKVCRKAARLAKGKKCMTNHMRKVLSFKWKKVRKRVRFFMGYRKGYCRISWGCRFSPKRKVYWCEP